MQMEREKDKCSRKPKITCFFSISKRCPLSVSPPALFSVMCYNVLCDKYATRQLYGYCPSWALNWEYRKKSIMQEIMGCNADIISLQVRDGRESMCLGFRRIECLFCTSFQIQQDQNNFGARDMFLATHEIDTIKITKIIKCYSINAPFCSRCGHFPTPGIGFECFSTFYRK